MIDNNATATTRYRDEPAFDLDSNDGPEVMPAEPTPEFIRHSRRVVSSLMGDRFRPGRMNCVNCDRCENVHFTRPHVGIIYTNGVDRIGSHYADGRVKVFCCGKCVNDTLREIENNPHFITKCQLQTYYMNAWDKLIKELTYRNEDWSVRHCRVVVEHLPEDQIDAHRLLTVCASAAKAMCANVKDPYDAALGHLCVKYGAEIGLPQKDTYEDYTKQERDRFYAEYIKQRWDQLADAQLIKRLEEDTYREKRAELFVAFIPTPHLAHMSCNTSAARIAFQRALFLAEQKQGARFDRAAAIRAHQEREVRRVPIWVTTPERSWDVPAMSQQPSLQDLINGFGCGNDR
jgi:hypothetical protein